MKGLLAGIAVCLGIGVIPASAHHSLAAYNLSTYKTVEGTIKTFEWSNPHAKLALIVPGPDGRGTEWDFEGGSIGRLTSGGWVKGAVGPGDKVTVAYNPRRSAAIGGFFIAVTTAAGTTYSIDRFKDLKAGNASEP